MPDRCRKEKPAAVALFARFIIDLCKGHSTRAQVIFYFRTRKEGENVPKQFKTVEFEDRKKIATMYADGAIAADIARQIGVSATTIYAELKRGQDGVTLDKNFRPAYDPDLAQKRVQENLRRRGRRKGP